jgi:guanylate kinase
MKNKKCVIFSAPSGAGKTTIVHHLLEKKFPLEFSISACSRPPRENEKDGVDYHFLGVEGFKQKITEDAFIEWEEVYPNHFYGTLKSEVERIWKNGNAVIFDVDVIGGLNLKKQFGKDALAIFVQAPSLAELEQRLRSRSTETEEKIQLRIDKAKNEIKFANHFDRILINDTLEKAFLEAENHISKFLAH